MKPAHIAAPGGYHMEYGFSCMGYEIAGALGIKMARPEADVICMVGDGSYMMANSELATAVMMGIGQALTEGTRYDDDGNRRDRNGVKVSPQSTERISDWQTPSMPHQP